MSRLWVFLGYASVSAFVVAAVGLVLVRIATGLISRRADSVMAQLQRLVKEADVLDAELDALQLKELRAEMDRMTAETKRLDAEATDAVAAKDSVRVENARAELRELTHNLELLRARGDAVDVAGADIRRRWDAHKLEFAKVKESADLVARLWAPIAFIMNVDRRARK